MNVKKIKKVMDENLSVHNINIKSKSSSTLIHLNNPSITGYDLVKHYTDF